MSASRRPGFVHHTARPTSRRSQVLKIRYPGVETDGKVGPRDGFYGAGSNGALVDEAQ